MLISLTEQIYAKHNFQSIAYSFGSVPFALMVFGLEMHYSTCPWLNDFYRKEILRKDFNTVEPYFDAQCAINGWALAGVSFSH